MTSSGSHFLSSQRPRLKSPLGLAGLSADSGGTDRLHRAARPEVPVLQFDLAGYREDDRPAERPTEPLSCGGERRRSIRRAGPGRTFGTPRTCTRAGGACRRSSASSGGPSWSRTACSPNQCSRAQRVGRGHSRTADRAGWAVVPVPGGDETFPWRRPCQSDGARPTRARAVPRAVRRVTDQPGSTRGRRSVF